MSGPDLVFCSLLSGWNREAPWLTSPHRVAGLPMTSPADCRLLSALLVDAMRGRKGDDLMRLVRWHHAVVRTRERAIVQRWPGWEE